MIIIIDSLHFLVIILLNIIKYIFTYFILAVEFFTQTSCNCYNTYINCFKNTINCLYFKWSSRRYY